MSDAWIVVIALILSTALIRASGPVALGGRDLPPRALNVVALLAPALLAGLVIVQTFGDDGELVLDERAAGVAAAGGVLAIKDSPLAAVVVAAAVTAALRALT
jgi:hypothetical protein